MEEVNPWLDPDTGNHKNKKSIKPEKKPDNIKETIDESKKDEMVPGYRKSSNEKALNFLEILVNESLDNKLPSHAEKWAIENFDKQWLDDFLSDIDILKDEILTSNYFPSQERMILLKLIFLLKQ